MSKKVDCAGCDVTESLIPWKVGALVITGISIALGASFMYTDIKVGSAEAKQDIVNVMRARVDEEAKETAGRIEVKIDDLRDAIARLETSTKTIRSHVRKISTLENVKRDVIQEVSNFKEYKSYTLQESPKLGGVGK